jgi:3-oxoacyl-[acyl-carrier-protein] synthase-3
MAKGLVETAQAKKVLLLTGETYSKLLDSADKSTRTLFGDAGTATLVASDEPGGGSMGPFLYGTDGSGRDDLIVRGGGFRITTPNAGGEAKLFMDGTRILNFSIRQVSASVSALLEKASLSMDEVDLFVFHQANGYMLEFLRRKCGIPEGKFFVYCDKVGNTVSNSIPIALHHAIRGGRVVRGSTVVLVGFGVGLSWAACVVRFWPEKWEPRFA